MVAMAFAYVSADDADAATVPDGYIRIGVENYYIIPYTDSRTYTDRSLPDCEGRYYIDSPSVRDGAFANCTKLVDVRMNTNVKSIGDGAFRNCTSLSYVHMSGVETIGDRAFEGSGVATFYMTSGLHSIGDGAFRDTFRLKKVPLWDTSVTEIPAGAFERTALEYVDLRNITVLDPTAFNDAETNLQMVRTDQDVFIKNVPRLFHDGPDGLMKGVTKSGDHVTVDLDEYQYLKVTEYGDDTDLTTYTDGIGEWSFYGHFYVEPWTNYQLELRDAVIDFPDDLGIADAVLGPKDFPYEMPIPQVGELKFQGWTVEGIGSGLTEFTREQMYKLLGVATAEPSFGFVDLYMDHSALEGVVDTKGLPVMDMFTYGGTYPQLEEVEGYRHVGWMVDGEQVAPGDPFDAYVSHTAASVWEPTVTYDVSYTAPDGSQVSLGDYGYNQRVPTEGLPVPEEAEDQRFLGWSTDGETPVDEVVLKDDVVLVPVFEEREPHTVTFDPDGSGATDTTVYDGRTFSLPEETPTSDTHVFLHWRDASGTTYAPGDEVTVDGDMSITAEWRERERYTVTFADGDSVVGEQTFVEGIASAISVTDPAKDGMVFLGWGDGAGTVYGNGDEMTVASDMRLAAQWRELQRYQVSYVSDGETVHTDTAEEGTEYTVGFGIEVPEGWLMTGWSDGETVHRDGDRLVPEGDMVLTAVWVERKVVTVTFDDGNGGATEFSGYEGDTFTVDIDDPVMPDLVFVTWTIDGTPVADGHSFTLSQDVTVVAQWREPYQYTVEFTDGGETLDVRTVIEGDGLTIDVQEPASVEADFVCWSYDGNEYRAGDTLVVVSDMVLEAVWEQKEVHTVTTPSPSSTGTPSSGRLRATKARP